MKKAMRSTGGFDCEWLQNNEIVLPSELVNLPVMETFLGAK